jgi:hypothetical protein
LTAKKRLVEAGSVAATHSRGKDHLPNRADVAAEMSGKAELPLYALLHEFNSHQNPACVVEGLETEHGLRAQLYAPVCFVWLV